MAATARETTASMTASPLAAVHQFGIIRSSFHTIHESELLELPEFVHTASSTTATTNAWLDFSALYIIPPQMMAGPMLFQVRQELGISHASMTAWYPYSTLSGSSARQWADVHVGVQADGLETTHPVWMTGRAMEAAATLKVYKPGPAGSQPDDVGTTEGDVYLFLRGNAAGRAPLVGELDAERAKWSVKSFSIWSDTHSPLVAGEQPGWIARAGVNGEISSRRITLNSSGLSKQRTSATVELEPYSRETADLRWQLNEAIAGNGLRSDEAVAQAELVIQSLIKMRSPALIYFLSPQWINARFPLQVDGPSEDPVRVFIVIMELPIAE